MTSWYSIDGSRLRKIWYRSVGSRNRTAEDGDSTGTRLLTTVDEDPVKIKIEDDSGTDKMMCPIDVCHLLTQVSADRFIETSSNWSTFVPCG
jgi:hypothetical protein